MFKCKICGSKTKTIISYGKQPIANGFIKNQKAKEYFFDLISVYCPSCHMVQLAKAPEPEMMFNAHYHFISSTSRVMAEHFEKQADAIIKFVAKRNDPLVVELGSNDGIMLRHIAKKGIRHVGIEPSENVADLAIKNGVNSVKKFFNVKTAQEIVKKYGQADVICGSNVTCHIEDLNSVAAGVNVLLRDDGVWFFEDPYIYDIVKKSSFDQMYDEHIYYFSGLSVRNFAERNGMQLVDMVPQEFHGGSMRYYLKKGSKNKVNKRVGNYIGLEKRLKLHKMDGYIKFKKNVDKICGDLAKLLKNLKKEGKSVVGYGATSKSTTILNYAKIGPDFIEYISDITPTKINTYTPGMHIPVKSYDVFAKNHPEYALLFAWNHKKEIMAKEKKYRKNGGKFITYFPKVTVE